MTRKPNRKAVDVLVSGRGTNMASLIRAALDPDFPAAVKRVISNNPDAPALAAAASADIPAICVDHRDFESRAAHEAALIKVIEAERPDLICLAGYMRILSPEFVARFRGRVLNIHPSLLPAFPGIDAHERALEAGVRVHGATVHFVKEGVDDGPIIAQAAVPVLTGDTSETLAARVLERENVLYPHALRMVASGQVRMSGGLAIFNAALNGGCGATIISPPLPERAERNPVAVGSATG